MKFSIKFDDNEVKKVLGKLQARTRNYQPVLNTIGDEMLVLYGKTNFRKRGKSVGSPWKRLSLSTVEARRKRRGYYARSPKSQGKSLIWTGRLQDGFKKTVRKTSLVISNTVDYFKYHQQSKGRPPQRKMLGLTKTIIGRVQKLFIKHIGL
jgi:phage gpG-like protein